MITKLPRSGETSSIIGAFQHSRREMVQMADLQTQRDVARERQEQYPCHGSDIVNSKLVNVYT